MIIAETQHKVKSKKENFEIQPTVSDLRKTLAMVEGGGDGGIGWGCWRYGCGRESGRDAGLRSGIV